MQHPSGDICNTFGTSNPYRLTFMSDNWIDDMVNTISVNYFQPKIISDMYTNKRCPPSSKNTFGPNHILVTLRWDDGRSSGRSNVCRWFLNR